LHLETSEISFRQVCSLASAIRIVSFFNMAIKLKFDNPPG
jgi:hypothetical protein